MAVRLLAVDVDKKWKLSTMKICGWERGFPEPPKTSFQVLHLKWEMAGKGMVGLGIWGGGGGLPHIE
jgi:hypothetical protein